MRATAGADPQALVLLGSQIRGTADELAAIRTNTTQFVAQLAWAGPVGIRFAEQWHRKHEPGLSSAAVALVSAAGTLARNAADQLAASEPTEATGFAPATATDSAERGLNGPRLVLDAHQESLRRQIDDPGVDEWISANRGVFYALEGLAAGIDLTSSFLMDAAQHPELPTDERIVHAISESALIYAAEAGITMAMRWAGTAIAGIITAGTGMLIGQAVGWAAGQVLSVGFRVLDNRVQLTERGGDLVVEQYRALRDDPERYLASVPAVAPYILAGRQTWQLAGNLFSHKDPVTEPHPSGTAPGGYPAAGAHPAGQSPDPATPAGTSAYGTADR